MAKHSEIDEYLAGLTEAQRSVAAQARQAIRSALPDASETISYQMPTFELEGRRIIHFAAWKHHLAIYPIPTGDDAFTAELAPYAGDKGTLRFPYDQPIPYDLIERIACRLAEG